MLTDADVADINQTSGAVEFVHDIGNVLAEMWTAAGDMTQAQAAIVHVLRHRLNEQSDGTWHMKFRFGESTLELLNGEQWEAIAAIAPQLDHPAARSVIADALWHKKIGSAPFTHAEAAIAAHSAICQELDHHPRSRVYSARRLADLVLSTNRPSSVATSAARLIEEMIYGLLAERQEDDDVQRSAGSLAPAVAAWAALRQAPTSQSDPITAVENSTDDPHALRDLAEIRHEYSDTASPADFDRAIDAFLYRGDLGDSSHRAIFYSSALALAERVQSPKAEAIRVAMQQDDPLADIDPQRTESLIPQSEVDRLSRHIVMADNPHAALKRLATNLMPLGKHAEPPFNGGIGDVIRHQILGPHGSVIRVIEEGGGTIEAHRSATIQTVWMYFVPALQRIFENYQPTKNELRQIFEGHEHISPAAADTLAEGLALYGEARYESSATTILPRLEQILRNIAVKASIKITKDQQGDKRGGVVGCGEVLSRLHDADPPDFPSAFASQLQFFLTDDLGFNLRNDVLHALYVVDDTPVKDWQASVIVACLVAVIHADNQHNPVTPSN